MRSLKWFGLVVGLLAIAACSSDDDDDGGGGGNVIPSTGNETVFAITRDNRLISFDPGSPGTLLSTQPLSGLVAGEELVAIDNRPGTGELFALGATSRVYTIDPRTGTATEVGVADEDGADRFHFGSQPDETNELYNRSVKA